MKKVILLFLVFSIGCSAQVRTKKIEKELDIKFSLFQEFIKDCYNDSSLVDLTKKGLQMVSSLDKDGKIVVDSNRVIRSIACPDGKIDCLVFHYEVYSRWMYLHKIASFENFLVWLENKSKGIKQ